MRTLRPLLLPVLLSLAACGSEPAPATVSTLPKDLATFTVASAGTLPGRGWDGVIEAVRRADLTAQTAGRVSVVNVDVNDRVKAGDVLLRITAVEQEADANAARAQLRAAEASAAEAEQNYRRFAALSGAQYVSKAQVDQARASRDSAAAARNAAAASLARAAQLATYTLVRAPFDGVMARRDVEPGETVAPGRALASVYAPDALRIEVAVPQTRADAIRRDPTAEVVLADGRKLVPAEVIVFPAADVASHSVNVRLKLPHLDAPPAPGTTAKVVFAADAVDADGAKGGVRIPASSIAQRGELSGVYVVADGRLLLRQLRLGARNGDMVDVISGLQPGDVVARDPVAATRAIAVQRTATGGRRD
ncbi:MAG: efflux RND transporter periplasmic adaptor subunit [Proteobacteria bacterium]|nr:efflux RND transporter periplasmic adaptor subunit [Pseudomonadota bacterium]MBS0217597.1 efflux RND transporter periplasmic adaptor subunit [Pseudomonadota bacterium]